MKTKTFPAKYLNALLIVQIALHFIVPIRQMIYAPYTYFGIILFVVGLVLNITWVQFLERQNTTSDFLETASRLVVTGPFQISRNPIYLSGVLLSIGVALFLGSMITVVIPAILFLILNSVHIPDEEQRLEQLFGEEFREYKRNVRRWL
jgi:protein-S-isoprenylcysteine O-methyltransferase Ste14